MELEKLTLIIQMGKATALSNLEIEFRAEVCFSVSIDTTLD